MTKKKEQRAGSSPRPLALRQCFKPLKSLKLSSHPDFELNRVKTKLL
jgi:hypothetical protein